MLTLPSPSPAGVYLVWDSHAQACPFLRYYLDLLSFRLLVVEEEVTPPCGTCYTKYLIPLQVGWLRFLSLP